MKGRSMLGLRMRNTKSELCRRTLGVAAWVSLQQQTASAGVEFERRTRAIMEKGGCAINVSNNACRSASP